MHRSLGYFHTLRKVIVTGLIIVSNREVSKITVHTDRGGTFYHGRISRDAEAQSFRGEDERANLDSGLRDDI